jgi:hypothetical protein
MNSESSQNVGANRIYSYKDKQPAPTLHRLITSRRRAHAETIQKSFGLRSVYK